MRTFLLLIAAGATATTATAAQTHQSVRVLNDATPIVQWYPFVKRDVVATVEPGTNLEILGKEGDWYWVITPRDANGTRGAGWIAASNVETVTEGAARLTLEPTRRDDARSPRPSATVPPPAASNSPVAVAITVGQGGTTSDGADARALRKEYSFDDVHFARNRYSLTPEETKVLDAAVNALKNDSVLRLNVDGYTCNLGTAAYNLALGKRRATAVKDYLVSQGVPVDRLRTVSFGEEHAKYSNSQEETRRLNRRVTLVPDVQP
jgi:peptidoglycan-associated lipoprotein